MKGKRLKIQLLLLLLMNYFTFALITNIPGILLPFWKEDFALSSTLVSFLGSAFFLAYGLTSLPQGILHDNIGSKKTLLWAVSLVLVGSMIFAFMPKYEVGLISLFIIGIGVTALQIVGNLLVKKVDDNPAKYSRNLTLAQVFCGIGGAGGGFLIGYLIKDLGFQWTSIYFIFGGLALLLAVFALTIKIPETAVEAGYSKPTKEDYLKLLSNPLMFLFALGIFIYVGIEVGIATWISTFLMENRAVDILLAAKIVSLYWIFQSVGRLIGGFVLNYLPAPKALIEYALAALACLIIAVVAPTANLSMIGFIAVGFFTSIMFPSIFSLAVNSFDKRQEGTVAGILCSAIAGGAITTPVIGFISALTNSLTLGLLVAGTVSFLYIALVGITTLRKPVLIPVDSGITESNINPEVKEEITA
ncbi:MAG: hypothetical protein A2287_10380 [Candidatus Melainabacteria bacterium RIFOXYA12_FULL_32_12]|nr:MAG: hypothetical protein A2255_05545 [Candidatus Melainabacteria bacterium RIFOXYA2_FULL_32_9]OGI29187.1 MAG: hypothetical protein A2287_10380 [Candidatus Melainabacteria bacterium RIFOXYA12_FULL_32_12]